jgi:hypothetical protein
LERKDVWLKTLHLGTEYDQNVRDALTEALRGAGAVRLRHHRFVVGNEVETWWYRVGLRLLRIHAETYLGLKIQGPARLVDRIAAEVRQPQSSGTSIRIEGWAHPPEPAVLLALAGHVVSAYVEVRFEGVPVPWEEWFRFARVCSARQLPDSEPCVRCETDSRFRLHLRWESGYVSPNGDVACEHCFAGRVTEGADLVDFPAAPSPHG